MVCLGPRKKEKKNNLLSPEDTTTSRGLKKSKLKKPSSSNSLAPTTTVPAASKLKAPSVVSSSVKKSPTRTSLESNKSRPPSRNSLLPTGRTPSPVHRSTSPHKPPSSSRPTSIASSVKTAATRTSAASTQSSNASRNSTHNTATATTTTKRFPITEMKEEVKGLKAKNEENLKLIADQQAELELLKQQLLSESSQVSSPPPADIGEDDHQAKEQLLLREKEIEELRIKLQQQEVPAIVIQDDEIDSKAEILAQKEKLLQEKEAKLEEQKRMMEEQVPQIEQVAMQLEALKSQNLNAVSQLASKEKELEELRSMIHEKPVEEVHDKQEALSKIEELNMQLEAQKKSHEESLRLHEEALAEKDILLKEQKESLESLQENHHQELQDLKNAQTSSILSIRKKHKQDKLALEKELEETKAEAEKNPAAAIDIDEHMERILQEFEQAEHSYTVQIKDMEESHQSELSHLEDNQKAQVKKLKRTQNLNRDSWTERYLPTDAVSWPVPNGSAVPKLRPTPSLVESKSKTLLRVLGNMPAYQKPEPVLTPLDPKKVQVYYSSVSGNAVIKRNQEQIQQLLTNNGVKFQLVDVAQSEAARQYAKKCNNAGKAFGRIKEFPQLYVGGEYRGQYDDLVRAIDDNALEEILHAAEERHFTSAERAAIQQAELNEELAGPMRMPPAVPALPLLRPTKSSVAKPVKTLKDYDEDEELLLALEKEFDAGNLNLDDL
ncbi:uncharacterized protein EV154DRAFT_463336 [Mucor mucedo]|uniref:uncharacterized protein n=1 Tax=Mucor mucedo TaxID=29922 RepID=UPI00221F36A1|nr:uncharacterized protein EV154DRAFT_463336 [Mucor mucedo]KAI7891937.1 hypothetical protein EV154DRAFT_463336 [Mucor mucedo]